MTSFLAFLDVALLFLQRAFFALAVVLGVVATIDWLVRTRRINQFGRIARFMRRSVDPLMAPIERQVVRSGGLPASAPWWALAAVVLGGIVLLTLLAFLRDQVVVAAMALQGGARGLTRLVIAWTFGLLSLALIVRVLSSWVRVSPYSKWVRWSFVLSEPILRPLRRIIPSLGMIDITPIVAYILLGLLQSFLMRLT